MQNGKSDEMKERGDDAYVKSVCAREKEREILWNISFLYIRF